MSVLAKKLIRQIRKRIKTKQGREATQADVAQLVGVSGTSIANWEAGKFVVTGESMQKLEEALTKLEIDAPIPAELAPRHEAKHRSSKSTGKNGKVAHKNGVASTGGGKLAAVLGDFAKGGVVDVNVKTEKKPKAPPGHPVATSDMKIPNEKAEAAKLAKFIKKVGIRPLNAATSVLCDDGGVFWQFVAEFTPAAMELLIKQYNEHNRVVGADRSKQYALDMNNNNWGFTGEPILFSRDGELLDGQNRLNAGRAYGRPLVFAVGFGVEPSAIRFMGRHFVRSNAHQGQAEGWSYNTVRTPTLGLLHRFERSIGAEKDYLEENGTGVRVGGARHEQLNSHYGQELDDALAFIHGLRWGIGRNVLPKHIATFMFMLMGRQSIEAARYFMLSLADATYALPGSPIYALRNRLLKMVADKRSSPGKHKQLVVTQIGKGETNAMIARGTEAIIMRTIASAWNSFCAGKKNTSGTFKAAYDGVTTTEVLQGLHKPCPRALKEVEAFTPEALDAVLKRAEACRLKEERAAKRKNSDDGDVKLNAIKRAIETN